MVGQTWPYHLLLLLVGLTLAVSGCATMSDPPLRTATDEARRAWQITQEREQMLTALRAEVASTRINAAKQEAELQALRATVTQLRQENSESQQALLEAKRTLEARQTELTAMKTERDQLAQETAQQNVSEQKLATLHDTVASLSQELAQLKQQMTVVTEHAAIDADTPPYDLSDAKTRRPLTKRSVLPSAPQRQSADDIIPAIHVVQEKADRSKSFWITVQPSESLWSLARKHKTTIEALRTINSLASDQLIVGQELQLP